MWKPEHRVAARRVSQRYESDLTDEEWSLVAPLIPPAKRSCQSALKWDPISAPKRDPSFWMMERPEAMRGAIGVAQRIDGGRPERPAIKRGS